EITIWVLAVCIHIPLFQYVSVHEEDPLLCDFPDITASVSVYLICHAFILFIIPAISLATIYGKIIAHQKSYQQPGRHLQRNWIEQQARKKRIIKVLISISATYIALSWPFFAATVRIAISGQSLMQLRQQSIFLFLLAFFSMAVTVSVVVLNPLIYLKFDQNIRKRALIILKRMELRVNRVVRISSRNADEDI
ncbi:hypothetical protein TrispH2_012228, partial [Trichoplax sp. H2]